MITPPVGFATYTACGISGASINKTGILGFKWMVPMWIVPYIFVYHPEMSFVGNYTGLQFITTIGATTIICLTISSLFQRYFMFANNWIDQFILLIACLLQFTFKWYFAVIGLFLLFLVRYLQTKRVEKSHIK